MNFIKAEYGDKMFLYMESVGYYYDEFPNLEILDIHFMYLDTDKEEDNPLMIAQIGVDLFHIFWYVDNKGQTVIEEIGSLEHVKSFLPMAYNSTYLK